MLEADISSLKKALRNDFIIKNNEDEKYILYFTVNP
jgi:hypothetical protein